MEICADLSGHYLALPFAVLGWSVGFLFGRWLGFARRSAAMVAGWMALIWAEVGLAHVLLPWFDNGAVVPALWAFPMLAVLVTGDVLWFYRDSTWQGGAVLEERDEG